MDDVMQIALIDVPNMTTADGHRFLKSQFADTITQAKLRGNGRGMSRGFLTKSDLENSVHETNIVQHSTIKAALHYINVEVMPLIITEQRFFSTKIKEFERVLPTPTPTLGTTRISRTRVHENMSSIKRFGQGAFMEGDFMETERGRDDYLAHIDAFTRAESDNLALMAYEKLYTQGSIAQFEQLTQRVVDYNSYIERLKLDRDMFCLPNKDRVGLPKLITYHAAEMKRYDDVEPNIAIAPALKFKHLMTTGNPQYYSYDKAGAAGPALLTGKYEQLTTINGISVRESPASLMSLGYERDYPDLERRAVFLGEFLYCGPHPDYKRLESDKAHGAFDVTVNAFKYVHFETLFKNNRLFKLVRRGEDLPYYFGGGMRVTAPYTGYYLDDEFIRDKMPNAERAFSDPANKNLPFYEWGVYQQKGGVTKLERSPFFNALVDRIIDESAFNAVMDELVRDRLGALNGVPLDELRANDTYRPHVRDVVAQQLKIRIGSGAINGAIFNDADMIRIMHYEVDQVNHGNAQWIISPKFAVPDIPDFDFSIEAWCKSGLLAHLAMRPMNGLYVNDAVLVQGGSQLGFTAKNMSSIHVGQDVGNISYKIEWRGEAAAHIVNPKFVRVMPNVSYDGIISGGNMTVITPEESEAIKRNEFRLEDIQSASVYSVVFPATAFDRDTEMVHLLGRHQWMGENPKEEYPNAGLYANIHGWSTAVMSDWNTPPTDMSYPVARVLFRSFAQYVNDNGMTIEIPGCTHHGPYEGPGHEPIRRRGVGLIPRPME